MPRGTGMSRTRRKRKPVAAGPLVTAADYFAELLARPAYAPGEAPPTETFEEYRSAYLCTIK